MPGLKYTITAESAQATREFQSFELAAARSYGNVVAAIPTNAIIAWTGTATNWTLCNLTNTIGEGGPTFVATNIATAGSFLLARPALTVTTYP